MLDEQSKHDFTDQFRDEWITLAVDATWNNDEDAYDDDDLHDVFLFGA